MKELTLINKAIKYGKSEIKAWEKTIKELEERKKELSKIKNK